MSLASEGGETDTPTRSLPTTAKTTTYGWPQLSGPQGRILGIPAGPRAAAQKYHLRNWCNGVGSASKSPDACGATQRGARLSRKHRPHIMLVAA